MAGAVDLTTYDYALKDLYPSEAMVRSVIENNTLVALATKDESFPGRQLDVAVVYANPGGRSKSMAVALSRAGGSQGVSFHIPRKKDYATIALDGELIEAADSGDGAIQGAVDAMKTEGDAALQQLNRSIGIDSYGDGSGSVAAIATGGINGLVITLSNASDAEKFEVGQYIVAALNASSAPRNSGDAARITAVNRSEDTGTITVNAVPSAWAAGDLLWFEGDYTAAGDTLAPAGLAAIFPSGTPGALHGVTRTVDRIRLAGHVITGTGMPIPEVLVRALSRISRYGNVDAVFMSLLRMEQLINLLGPTKVRYNETEIAGIGFRGVEIVYGRGKATAYSDVNCPDSLAYPVTMKHLKIKSAGKLPKWLDKDGQIFRAHPSDDSYVARVGCYYNWVCNAPATGGVITSFGS